eukprot:scaffold2668_cov115-Isochrysis_galbana.AAC.14
MPLRLPPRPRTSPPAGAPTPTRAVPTPTQTRANQHAHSALGTAARNGSPPPLPSPAVPAPPPRCWPPVPRPRACGTQSHGPPPSPAPRNASSPTLAPCERLRRPRPRPQARHAARKRLLAAPLRILTPAPPHVARPPPPPRQPLPAPARASPPPPAAPLSAADGSARPRGHRLSAGRPPVSATSARGQPRRRASAPPARLRRGTRVGQCPGRQRRPPRLLPRRCRAPCRLHGHRGSPVAHCHASVYRARRPPVEADRPAVARQFHPTSPREAAHHPSPPPGGSHPKASGGTRPAGRVRHWPTAA